MKKALFLTAVILWISGIASAGLLTPNGSFAFALQDCCYLNGASGSNPGVGDLLTAATIGWSTFAGQPDFQNQESRPMTFGNPNIFESLYLDYGDITPTEVQTAGGDSLTVGFAVNNSNTAIIGDEYQFISSSESVAIDTVNRAVNYYFLGTFHDLNSPQIYSDAPASLTLTFTQTAPDASISGGGTFSTPPSPDNFGAPEPATVALIGAALTGLAAMRRKKA